MQLSKEGKLYDIFEEKLIEISERVGYGGEEVSSEKHRVFEEAWNTLCFSEGVRGGLELLPARSRRVQDDRVYLGLDAELASFLPRQHELSGRIQ